jgi:hypothetical protein
LLDLETMMTSFDFTGAVEPTQDDWGFVYVIGHPQMPNVYKIGKTNRHPIIRCQELSNSTSAPGNFILVAAFDSAHHGKLEVEVHRQFAEFRIASNREFFHLSNENLARVLACLEEGAVSGNYYAGMAERLMLSVLRSGV